MSSHVPGSAAPAALFTTLPPADTAEFVVLELGKFRKARHAEVSRHLLSGDSAIAFR